MDIDSWLRGIGLDQYAETFRANDIDGELLWELSVWNGHYAWPNGFHHIRHYGFLANGHRAGPGSGYGDLGA